MPDMMIKCLDCEMRYNKDWGECPRCKLSKFTSNVLSPEEEKLIASESKSQALEKKKFIKEWVESMEKNPPKIVPFNEPSHYHTHEIDTIEFLKRGFPPGVFTGFLIGNIIKYTQRFEYKNGEDDLVKVVDYSKRLQEWYKETH